MALGQLDQFFRSKRMLTRWLSWALAAGALALLVGIGLLAHLKPADWAIWIQAVSSVLTVLVAVIVTHWYPERRLVHQRQEARRNTERAVRRLAEEIVEGLIPHRDPLAQRPGYVCEIANHTVQHWHTRLEGINPAGLDEEAWLRVKAIQRALRQVASRMLSPVSKPLSRDELRALLEDLLISCQLRVGRWRRADFFRRFSRGTASPPKIYVFVEGCTSEQLVRASEAAQRFFLSEGVDPVDATTAFHKLEGWQMTGYAEDESAPTEQDVHCAETWQGGVQAGCEATGADWRGGLPPGFDLAFDEEDMKALRARLSGKSSPRSR